MRIATLAAILFAVPVFAATPPKPENLARKAKASASSEYSGQYLAKFATDGIVPEPLNHDDVNRAWAVNGSKERNGAWFRLEWPEPVKVAEIVYYGRTAWFLEECWKDYEVRFDDQPAVAAKGTFAMDSAPQRIKVPPSMVRKIEVKFTSSYGGENPGASEIEVYSESPPKEALNKTPSLASLQEESPELAKAVQDGRLGFDKLVVVERRELNPSHVYTICAEGFGPGGGLYVLSPPTPDGKLTKLVDSPKGQIMDCDVSYDGQEILFSWRREAKEGYHLWRTHADGTGLAQLTSGECHDYNACWLPDGGIAFISTRAATVPLCWVTPAGALFRMDRDGANLRRLSANYVNDFTPSVLADGRILYSRWEYVDKPAIPIQSMWTMFPDGTNLSVFFGNGVLSPASKLEGRAIPGTTAVMCTLTAHAGPIRGAIGVIDRNHGLDAQASITNLTPQVNIGRVYEGDGDGVRGPFENPCPIDAERFLVSNRGSIVVGSRSGGWAVVRPRGESLGLYNPQPLRPRPRPPLIESYSEDRPEGEATVYILDIYQGLLPHVPRGSIRWIAVVQELAKSIRTQVFGFGFQNPVMSCGATYACKRVWGFVPVEADGSAYFRVPTGVPLYFLALDENGQAVQRMRSFTHFVPGERRGCIGCHEPRNTTSPASLPSSLASSSNSSLPVPAPSSHSAIRIPHSAFPPALALTQQPRALEPPEWGTDSFDYCRVVQPVLDKFCTSCHSGPLAAQRIDLSGDRTDWFSVSYDVLTHGYVSWINTQNGNEANILQITPKAWGSPASKLAALILAGHPDKDGKPRVAMDAASRRRIFTWIDLNVPYYSTYAIAHPEAEGGRRIIPRDLKARLAEVAARRCAECHQRGVPQRPFLRITNPELNDFLVAPLAKAAGGRESCRKIVFESKQDPDYQALLKCFEPVASLLAQRPRMDMPGAVPAKINSSCQ